MVSFVFIGSCQMGNQAAVVAGDDDSASTCGLDVVHMVFCMKPFLVAGILENVGIFIAPNAADVKHRVRRKHILFRKVSNYFPLLREQFSNSLLNGRGKPFVYLTAYDRGSR